MSDNSSFAVDFVRNIGVRIDDSQPLSTRVQSPKVPEKADQKGDEALKIELADDLDLAHLTKLPSRSSLLKILDSLATQTRLISAGSAEALKSHIVGSVRAEQEAQALLRITYLAYAVSLDALLKKAEILGDQEWFWSDIEDELLQTSRYFLQTLPGRLFALAENASKLVYDNASQTLSTVTADRPAAGLRSLLDGRTFAEAWSLVRTSPTFAVASMFPCTRQSVDNDLSKQPKLNFSLLRPSALSPVRLTRHEARHKRKRLVNERDKLATKIGELSIKMRQQQSSTLGEALKTPEEAFKHVVELTATLGAVVSGCDSYASSSQNPIEQLQDILASRLAQHDPSAVYSTMLKPAPFGLGPPSTLARLWLSFVFVPTVSLILLKAFTRNKDAILGSVRNAKETIRGFLVGWVYEPVVRLLDTIRHGEAADGVIISKESLNSDLQSLERMVTDFSAEKYSLSLQELEQVAAKVKEGDLTHVLRIYEAELKSPLKSAVTGSLIRTLLIQIQKAKVDLEVAMSGIDSLLKSQQLLFGAVGIAPAMGILYVTVSWFKNRLSQASNRQGRAAGYDVKIRAWEALRRVDKLLAAPAGKEGGELDAKTQGLLLLDLALLRLVAEPLVASVAVSRKRGTRKKLHQQFLQDIRELEGLQATADGPQFVADVGLAWNSRRAVMDCVWRSWGPLIAFQ
ncbi:NCA2-domain-containing protein [Tilletiaria anomala UBC 951]|uniref:NCA2-domain-containing protein n=1 Tax=Tilletiaria anomala (strain ATCC 24038 / CBS 436.72 / UBC 951) TaxID=1037660 RepID=A0A066VEH9_TILAU|nr:NCA2-domain-containing protein [Tilletiaria anomala UBC 951]KDN40157.1 NCA2-domain-containing protein [Tilletiaria anomala UBC 951]